MIDRFEGTYAICEDKDQNFSPLKPMSFPPGQRRNGFRIDDEGVIRVNEEKRRRAARIKSSGQALERIKDGKSRPSRMQEDGFLSI
ncbi:MAG: hypothetical protein ACLS8R_09495 [Anaeromassilibacillus sp.]